MKSSFLIHEYTQQHFFRIEIYLSIPKKIISDWEAATFWRVCIDSTTLFSLKLKGDFFSCSNSAQAPREHATGWRSLSETPLQSKVGTFSFFPSHSQLLAPTASWPWAVGKLQLLTENKLCRRKGSVRTASCSPFPVTALHGQSWHRCRGRSMKPKGVRGSPHNFRSTWVTLAVPTQFEFRLFQVVQNQEIDKLYVSKKIPSFL